MRPQFNIRVVEHLGKDLISIAYPACWVGATLILTGLEYAFGQRALFDTGNRTDRARPFAVAISRLHSDYLGITDTQSALRVRSGSAAVLVQVVRQSPLLMRLPGSRATDLVYPEAQRG